MSSVGITPFMGPLTGRGFGTWGNEVFFSLSKRGLQLRGGLPFFQELRGEVEVFCCFFFLGKNASQNVSRKEGWQSCEMHVFKELPEGGGVEVVFFWGGGREGVQEGRGIEDFFWGGGISWKEGR